MNKDRMPLGTLPSFETMPTLSDENIADVLQWLIVFVDAFEDHYADPLARWREKRYEEIHEDFDNGQLRLPIVPRIDEPF